jgi:serine-type D-Ala-D-Ala carboxypeptidase/endopeptidase
VALIEGGETRFVAHGSFATDSDQQVDENTVFEAGSISKVFTSLVLAQLVDEGQIDLDAPIADYLPEGTALPAWEGREITAFDLATHSSGLPPIPDDLVERGLDNPYSGYGAEPLFAWLAEYELTRPIGEEFEYSNAGIALLGQAIAHVTGEDFSGLVEERIFTSLGMEQSGFNLTGNPLPPMPTGHDQAMTPVGYWDWDAFAPAGGLISTAADLGRFVAAASHAVDTPLAPAFDTMLARTRPAGGKEAIGLGWFIRPTGSGEIVWHNGITNGFRSFAGFERTSGNGVVVLANMVTAAGIEDIGFHLLDPSQPLTVQPEPREAVEIDPAVLPGLVGEYVLAPGTVMSVTVEDNRLFAQLTGQNRFELYPESETEFFYRVVDAQVSFVLEDGEAASLVLHQNGQDMPAMRVE